MTSVVLYDHFLRKPQTVCVQWHYAPTFLQIKDTIGFDTLGHCFFLEDGVEQRNILFHNLGLLTKPGTLLPTDRNSSMCTIMRDGVFGNYVPVPTTDCMWVITGQGVGWWSNPWTFGGTVAGVGFRWRMFQSPSTMPCRAVSTFWIAHPNNHLINNAAAGSQVNYIVLTVFMLWLCWLPWEWCLWWKRDTIFWCCLSSWEWADWDDSHFSKSLPVRSFCLDRRPMKEHRWAGLGVCPLQEGLTVCSMWSFWFLVFSSLVDKQHITSNSGAHGKGRPSHVLIGMRQCVDYSVILVKEHIFFGKCKG